MPEEPKGLKKVGILDNWKYVLLNGNKNWSWSFIKDEAELKRMLHEEEIKDGSVVIEITAGNLMVAELRHIVELR